MPAQGMNPLNPAPPAARTAAAGRPTEATQGAPGVFARLLGGATPSTANPLSGHRGNPTGADDPQTEAIGTRARSGSGDLVDPPSAPPGLDDLWAMLGLAAAPTHPLSTPAVPTTAEADLMTVAASSDPEVLATMAMADPARAAGGVAADPVPDTLAGLAAAEAFVAPDRSPHTPLAAVDQGTHARAAAPVLSSPMRELPFARAAMAAAIGTRLPAGAAPRGEPVTVAPDSLAGPLTTMSVIGPARVRAASVPETLHAARFLAAPDVGADAGIAAPLQPAMTSAIPDDLLETLPGFPDGRVATPAPAVGAERANSLTDLFAPAGASSMPPAMDRTSTPLLAPGVIDLRLPQASQQLAESVVWQLDQSAQEVRIRLNPQELGAVDVQLRLDGDKVSVRFDMADASVRDVVQTSLPQLSSMLAARGLALDQAQVFSQDRGQSPPQGEASSPDASGRRSPTEASADADLSPVWHRSTRLGLVDDYA